MYFNKKWKLKKIVLAFAIICTITFIIRNINESKFNPPESSIDTSINWYAVFSASSPDGFFRDYDYIFNLPLTALSWKRIGFQSVVLVIGSKHVWMIDSLLSYVVNSLSELNATTIFIESPEQHWMMLGQTARLFAASLPEFPGKAEDYIITSDADLWPLRKNHYVPINNIQLILVHSRCCSNFQFNSKTYRMLPLSHIGARAFIWRQIMNCSVINSNISETIVSYFEQIFGSAARNKVQYEKETWFYDQKMISIRIDQWIKKNVHHSVLEVSDQGYTRMDRRYWNIHEINRNNFDRKYDTHLLNEGYLPHVWQQIQPLIHLMYGEYSWEMKWADEYAHNFYKKMVSARNLS